MCLRDIRNCKTSTYITYLFYFYDDHLYVFDKVKKSTLKTPSLKKSRQERRMIILYSHGYAYYFYIRTYRQ